jgi:hypothetical protein
LGPKTNWFLSANEPNLTRNGAKETHFVGNRTRICESKGGSGWAGTMGLHELRVWRLEALEIRRGQRLAVGQATGAAQCKEASDALH